MYQKGSVPSLHHVCGRCQEPHNVLAWQGCYLSSILDPGNMPVTKTFNGSPGDTNTHWPHILINPINHLLCQLFDRYLKFLWSKRKKIGKTAYNCIRITWPGPRASPPAGWAWGSTRTRDTRPVATGARPRGRSRRGQDPQGDTHCNSI